MSSTRSSGCEWTRMPPRPGYEAGGCNWPWSLLPGWPSLAPRCRWRGRDRLPPQPSPPSHLGTQRCVARRNHRVLRSQAEAFAVFVRTQLVEHGEMAFEHLLLLAAHQADEVIPAERSAHRNCGLWPCRCGLRPMPNLRQTASHQSDDDFELGGHHSVGGDVRGNNLRSQLENFASVQGAAHCMLQSNESVGFIYRQSRDTVHSEEMIQTLSYLKLEIT